MTLAEAHARLTAPGMPFEMAECSIRGLPTRVFRNAPPTLRELFVAGRAHGSKTFLVYDDDRASFEGFCRAALAVSHALIDQGVRKGDRVALAMRNLPEWPAVMFGALLAGAIVTPLNAWWTGAELEYGLTDSGSKVLFVDAERLERLAEHLHNCPDLVRVYVTRDDDEIAHPKVRRLEDVTGPVAGWDALPDRPYPDVPIEPDDDATILYTSGTTGKPKGALGTHRNGTCSTVAAMLNHARNFLRRGEPMPQPDPAAPQKSVLLAIPFFHTTGCHAILCPSLFGGSKLVLLHRWDAEVAMKLIERERVTSAGGVPTIAWQLIEHPGRSRYDLSSLESVSYGGAPRLGRAGAPDQGGVPQVGARAGLGHDRDVGDLHRPLGRGLREPARQQRARVAGVRDEGRRRARRGAAARRRSASSGPGDPTSCAATGTSPRRLPRPSSTAGCAPATSRASTTRASCSWSTARRTC